MDEIRREGPLKARANGIQIAYESFGEPGDPVILLVMGLGQQMIFWDEGFCVRLAGEGFRVIRFDNRDVGLSTWFKGTRVPSMEELLTARLRGLGLESPYTLEDMARDGIGLLDELKIERAHVVGLSMGGMIGQIMAMGWPQRTITVTSIMSSTGDPGLPPPRPEALALLTTPLPTEREPFIQASVEGWRVLDAKAFPQDEERLRGLFAAAYDRGLNPAGFARQFAAIVASGSRKQGLASLAVPTLVVHGEADPLVPVECGVATADAIPGARLMVVEKMGHTLPAPLWGRIIGAIANHARRG
jgi:pimeloyl-ACP methyl ester carboxylesterase